jgi:hypothetical protein
MPVGQNLQAPPLRILGVSLRPISCVAVRKDCDLVHTSSAACCDITSSSAY